MKIPISKCKILLSYFGEGQDLVADSPRALLPLHSKKAWQMRKDGTYLLKMTKIVCKHDTQCLQLTISSSRISQC